MSDLLVILGAGASHDALRPGAEEPPLTAQLFDATYDDIQFSFPGVDGLRDVILSRVEQGRALEQVLGELVANEAHDIRRQVFEVPIYLKMLLGKYTRTRPGTYDTLITLIQERDLSVTFVTTNYDTLLDEAIQRKYGPDGVITSISDYNRIDRRWKYIKLHGSVNWGYQTQIPEGPLIPMNHSWIGEYRKQVKHGVTYDNKVELLNDNGLLATNSRLIYPALAIPTNRKTDYVCPEDHVTALRTAIRANPSVLVIGHQGRDADLMGILKEEAPAASDKPLQVVDPNNGIEVANRFSEALNRRGFTVPQDGVEFRQFVMGEGARFLDNVLTASR